MAAKDLAQPRLASRDWSTVWSEFRNPMDHALTTDLTLSPSYYGFTANNHLERTIRVTNDTLVVERSYNGGLLGTPTTFNTRWRLLLPEAKLAKATVQGGGNDLLLDLRYAAPGGIRGFKTGDRLPGLDAMDAHFDDVRAVSDAEVVKLPIASDSQGNITIQLDRGDGLAVVLSTPTDGWRAVELQPVVDKKYLSIQLIGRPVTSDPRGRELGSSRRKRSQPRWCRRHSQRPALPTTPALPSKPSKVRITGKTTAVNEMDGAEMAWIPPAISCAGAPMAKAPPTSVRRGKSR